MEFKAVALLALCSSLPVFGQSAAGVAAIGGVVRDASGAVVPGAQIVIFSAARGSVRTLTSNENGVFTAPGLTPGSG